MCLFHDSCGKRFAVESLCFFNGPKSMVVLFCCFCSPLVVFAMVQNLDFVFEGLVPSRMISMERKSYTKYI